MSDAEMLYAALAYIARGMPVFPCRNDKRPYTEHGFKDASRDPDQVTKWWTEHPDALIGIPTGTVSDLFVVDVDRKSHDGFATLKNAGIAFDGSVPQVLTP